MRTGRYFADRKSFMSVLVRSFVALLLVFSVVFFLWSIMKYNKINDQKKENEKYISELNDEIEELQYLVDMPLDDEYKIRVARERLGMCFPDEVIFYTNID